MPKNKIKVLSTRPLPVSLLREAEHAGICMESLAFIHTEPVRETAVLEEISDIMHQPATVVFTSMNAAEAVGTELHGRRPQWKIFCMGNTTLRIVHRYFKNSDVSGTAGNASMLANEVLQSHPEKVIFFCGDQRRDELPTKLASKNIALREIVVYKTRATPHKIEEQLDGVLFFSPSAVESFFSVNTVPANVVLFAIGTTTAERIGAFCTNKVLVSDMPGKDALAKLAIDYFDKINHT